MAYYRWNGSNYVVAFQRLLPDGKWYLYPDLADSVSTLLQPVRMSIDAVGNGVVAYHKAAPPTNYTIKAAAFGGTGWGTPYLVAEDTDMQNATDFKVAMLGPNRALVFWREYDGAYWI